MTSPASSAAVPQRVGSPGVGRGGLGRFWICVYYLNISGLWPVSRRRHTGHGQETGPSFPSFLS